MSDSSTRSPLETVQLNYAALGRRDIETLMALSDPAITIYQSDLLPWGGRRQGKDGLLAFLTTVQTHLDSDVEPDQMFAAGNRVVQTGRTRGTARVTGRTFDAPEVHIWEVKDGLVASFEAYVDTDELLRAITP